MLDQHDRWWSSMDSVRRVEGWAFIGGSVLIAIIALARLVATGDAAALAILPVCLGLGAGAAWIIRSLVRERAGEWEHEALHWAVGSHHGRTQIPSWVTEWQAQQLLHWAIERGGPDPSVSKELVRRLKQRPQYPVPTPVPPPPWLSVK